MVLVHLSSILESTSVLLGRASSILYPVPARLENYPDDLLTVPKGISAFYMFGKTASTVQYYVVSSNRKAAKKNKRSIRKPVITSHYVDIDLENNPIDQ